MTDIAYAKRAMLKALRTSGIATVSIAYDGEGDSGQIARNLCLRRQGAAGRHRSARPPCSLPRQGGERLRLTSRGAR